MDKKLDLAISAIHFLAISVVILGAYHWRSWEHERTVEQRDQAAVALSSLRPSPELNQLLASVGRSDLAKPVKTPTPTEVPAPSAIAGGK